MAALSLDFLAEVGNGEWGTKIDKTLHLQETSMNFIHNLKMKILLALFPVPGFLFSSLLKLQAIGKSYFQEWYRLENTTVVMRYSRGHKDEKYTHLYGRY